MKFETGLSRESNRLANANVKKLNSVAGLAIKCPLYKDRLSSLGTTHRHVIVDLGSARSSTLAALHGLRCKINVLDLPELLALYPNKSDSNVLMKAIAERILSSTVEQAELVFCWTLLNYLNPQQIQGLISLLDKQLGPDVKIHALVEYSETLMPTEPAAVSAEGREQLLIESKEPISVPSPRYSLGVLEKNMPGFKAERTMLLGNGMHEYLFCRRS